MNVVLPCACMTSENSKFGVNTLIRIKHSVLDVWQGSEYASAICHSFFGKTEDANKIDSVAM